MSEVALRRPRLALRSAYSILTLVVWTLVADRRGWMAFGVCTGVCTERAVVQP